MIDLSKVLDPYERKARLYPSLICLFPLMIAVSISYPIVFSTLSGFVVLAAAIGILQFLAHLSRDRGKLLEPKLFREWGGIPSVNIFRFSDDTIPPPAKLKYHLALGKMSGISAPSRELELTDPKKADDIYLSWSDFLRGTTRDVLKYPLLFKENINYGFRRNLLGIKWFCIISGLISIIVLFSPYLQTKTISGSQISVAILITVYIVVFFAIVNKSWVKLVSTAYARQLIEAVNA